MNKIIDCFFIGHNEMQFVEYEKSIRKMGVQGGAYRDLNLNFIRYDNRPYTVSEIVNLFSQEYDSENQNKKLNLQDTFNTAIAYLCSYLNKRGFTYDFVNSFQDNKKVLAEKLSHKNILTIAITTTFYVSALPILEIIEFIKRYNPNAKIILGGPFVSTQVRVQDHESLYHLFDSTIGADIYVNSSQGEATLVKIIEALKHDLPLDNIKNIYFRGQDGTGLKETFVEDENNKLAENMVNWDLFAGHIGEFAAVRTTVSCPFSCAFCGYPEHAGKFQLVPVDDVEKELIQINRLGKIELINFIDDTFNVPIERFKEILKILIKNKFSFKWYSYLRCQYVDGETVRMMKDSGCEGVFLGIESGNDQILKNMNKATNTDSYLRGIELLKEQEIVTFGNFIIGFPGETPETVENTVSFIKKSGLDFFRCQLWYFEPITPIWRKKEAYLLSGESFEWEHCTMNSKTACDYIEQTFLSFDGSGPVWIPQYNFDFGAVWHLIHSGMSLGKVKQLLNWFNRGVKEKLIKPTAKEISLEVIKGLKEACVEISDIEKTVNTGEEEKRQGIDSVSFNFG